MFLFLSSFLGVFLLGLQQQNVIHGHYKLAGFTSMLIAVTQYGIITGVVANGPIAIVIIGIGGALGITTSMYAHRKWIKK